MNFSDTSDQIDSADLAPLQAAFRDQLVACLEECARGRCGLFAEQEHLGEAARYRPWPEAARLRQLAFALQAILAQSGDADPLCEQFLDLCGIHGENDPGEPRLARAFRNQIQQDRPTRPTPDGEAEPARIAFPKPGARAAKARKTAFHSDPDAGMDPDAGTDSDSGETW